MHDFQRDFLTFALACQALRFGEFTLKSGRVSPYFFNIARFDTGARLARLGEFYARAILEARIGFDMLFGPAYKGIALVNATAIALAEHFRRDVPYVFNRKEVKTYAEGGMLVGHPPQGRVLIVDDVISSGASVRESVQIIQAAGAVPAGVAIALDLQERGEDKLSAVQEVESVLGLPVVSIVTLDNLLRHVSERADVQQHAPAIHAYRRQYGT